MTNLTSMKKLQRGTVCMRNFELSLWAIVKRRAQDEGMQISEWVERALIRALAWGDRRGYAFEASGE